MDPVVQPVVNPAPAAATTPAAQPTPPPSVGVDITGVTMPVPPAAGTPTTATPASAELGSEGAQDTKTPDAIPYTRFSEVVAEKNRMAEQVQQLQAKVQVMEEFARNGVPGQPQAGTTPQAPEVPVSIGEQVVREVLGEEPYANRDQLGKVMARFEQVISSKIAELAFIAQTPDYSQMVNGNPDSPLAQALKSDPGLVQVIRKSADPLQTAYLIAKRFGKAAVATPTPPPPPPPPPPPVVPTIGAAGGRGSIGGKPNFNTMTEAEFQAYRQNQLNISPAV